MPHLMCFGYGYCARALARMLASRGWRVSATYRSAGKAGQIERDGHFGVAFDDPAALEQVSEKAQAGVSHVLASAPPGDEGDPVLAAFADKLAARRADLRWLGYLSTTSVYGDQAGGWVDETAEIAPTSERGKKRARAEAQWRALLDHDLPAHIFRLAGIYGPGRNQLKSLLAGKARRIVKPGQVFCRIHIDDIAAVLSASIARPAPGEAYNIADDLPSPPQEVISFAAKLLNRTPPPELPLEEAGLTGLAAAFYAENKRVANDKIKRELGVALKYPTYRDGLRALLNGALNDHAGAA